LFVNHSLLKLKKILASAKRVLTCKNGTGQEICTGTETSCRWFRSKIIYTGTAWSSITPLCMCLDNRGTYIRSKSMFPYSRGT